MKFRVEITGDREIAELLNRIPKEKRAEVKAAVGDMALKIQKRAKMYLRTLQTQDTGHLSTSILAEFSEWGKIEAEIGPTAKYGPYVEFGTGVFGPKGMRLQKMPPPDALEAWARHHGFDSAWPVCKAILKRGVLRARPYLAPAYDDFEGEVLIRLQRIMGKEWK